MKQYKYPHLSHLWAKGTHFLGTRYALLGGAMTWISNHALVAAISEAGGFGVLAGGSLSPEELKIEIEKTQEKTSLPFGVNLILFHPRLLDLIDVCQEKKVSHLFLGGGFPSRDLIRYLHQFPIGLVGFAPSLPIARRLIASGIHALVLEGHEAGGHVGPVSTSVLAQEILPALGDIPFFVAGGIGDGRGIASYLFMGASGCQMGTRFVCAEESCAHPAFKKAFLKAQARDATLSSSLDPRFPVIPVRSLENKGKREFLVYQKEVIDDYNQGLLSLEEARLKIEMFWAGSLKRAVIEGDIETGSVMAGQSVGMVKKIEPCSMIIQNLLEEAESVLKGFYKNKVL